MHALLMPLRAYSHNTQQKAAESFKIFISISIKTIAILLKNMSAGKKDYTIR